jgi:hypothetical protein
MFSPARHNLPASANDGIVPSRPWLCVALLILTLTSPALLIAQFQEPTQEELKMTADPKAPGASAVYLYHEDSTDNSNHSHIVYDRIKVLTEKGKELATVSIPYEHGVDKVGQIEGRTIHADGTVIPLTATPSDLVDFKTKGLQLNSVVFTLPSVEVGSILEYRMKLRRDDRWSYLPTWQIQGSYFIHKAHYSFRPGEYWSMMYAVYLGSENNAVQKKKDTFTLDITDAPPEPNDDWMPPLNTLRWHVEFFSNTLGADDFWQKTRIHWAAWIGDFTKPTDSLTKAVSEIVAPGDTDEQKAAKIYVAVQKLDNTSFSRTKSEAERKKEKLKDIKKAEDVWEQQSGSANDIALLFAALARSAGLKVWPAFVVNRDRAAFDMSYLSDSQFDDDLVMVELGGKKVYLDPGQKMCPFGSLHWKHTLATGFQLRDNSAEIATTPGLTYKGSTVQRLADLYIDKEGNVKGSVRFVMTGPSALHWRQLALESDEDEVKKQFNESMSGQLPESVQADFDHFLGLEDYNSVLVAIVKVTGNIVSATGKRLFLPGLFFESRAKHPFVAQEKRTIPIDVHFPESDQDQVTYHLPPAFNIESMPQDVNYSWPDHAQFKIHSTEEDGSATVSRTLAYNFTLLDPKEYPNLHDFYLKVASADQQQLVLTRAPVAKGN